MSSLLIVLDCWLYMINVSPNHRQTKGKKKIIKSCLIVVIKIRFRTFGTYDKCKVIKEGSIELLS